MRVTGPNRWAADRRPAAKHAPATAAPRPAPAATVLRARTAAHAVIAPLSALRATAFVVLLDSANAVRRPDSAFHAATRPTRAASFAGAASLTSPAALATGSGAEPAARAGDFADGAAFDRGEWPAPRAFPAAVPLARAVVLRLFDAADFDVPAALSEALSEFTLSSAMVFA